MLQSLLAMTNCTSCHESQPGSPPYPCHVTAHTGKPQAYDTVRQIETMHKVKTSTPCNTCNSLTLSPCRNNGHAMQCHLPLCAKCLMLACLPQASCMPMALPHNEAMTTRLSACKGNNVKQQAKHRAPQSLPCHKNKVPACTKSVCKGSMRALHSCRMTLLASAIQALPSERGEPLLRVHNSLHQRFYPLLPKICQAESASHGTQAPKSWHLAKPLSLPFPEKAAAGGCRCLARHQPPK